MKKDYINRYFKYLNEKDINTINSINEKIDSLDNETKRKFISAIRGCFPRSKESYNKSIEFIDQYPKHEVKKLENVKFANDTYDQLGIDEKSRHLHWEYFFKYQQKIHNDTKHNKKLPRQDNKDYINYGGGASSWPTIRYPKKCRKTAWKRFYRLFPHLKPKDE